MKLRIIFYLLASIFMMNGCASTRYTPPTDVPLSKLQFKTLNIVARPYFCMSDGKRHNVGGKLLKEDLKIIFNSLGEYHSIDIEVPSGQEIIIGMNGGNAFFLAGTYVDATCDAATSFYAEKGRNYLILFQRTANHCGAVVFDITNGEKSRVNQKSMKVDTCS